MACSFKIPEIITCPPLFKLLRIDGAKPIKGGFKILSGDIDLFQDVINQLLNNKKLVEDYGNNAYKLLINKYNVKKSYDLIIEKLIQ